MVANLPSKARDKVWSSVRELGSHMPHDQKTKTKDRSNIVTNSIKTLKWFRNKNKKFFFKKKTSTKRMVLPIGSVRTTTDKGST